MDKFHCFWINYLQIHDYFSLFYYKKKYIYIALAKFAKNIVKNIYKIKLILYYYI